MSLVLSLVLVLAPHAAAQAPAPVRSAAASAPELGSWHALMFHERARKLVLLNGGPESGKAATDPLELWEWTGAAWRELRSHGPRWRNRASVAYDARRGVLVLYGGSQPSEDFDDTWEWDGERWSERPAVGPGPREGAGLAFDAARGVTVLFGGAEHGEARGDTWTWDGERWTRASVTGPSPRVSAALAFDPERALVLLFGGHTIGARGLRVHGDAWTWDGATWTRLEVDRRSAAVDARAARACDPRDARASVAGIARDRSGCGG